MMDHILAIDPAASVALLRDWYGMHVKLSKQLGPRVSADGDTRWQFSVDPALAGTGLEGARFVRLRTHSSDLHAVAGSMGQSLGLVSEVRAGGLAEVHLTASLRTSYSHGSDRIHDRDLLEASAQRLLRNAGLDQSSLVIEAIDWVKVHISKGRGNKFAITGLRVSATGIVSDEGLLRKAIQNGVGRDRAYGFGVFVCSGLEAN